jgi:hypothetical protein
MTAAITTLRQTLADILDNPGVWSTFAFPPATPIANSVIISPDDPYIVPANNLQVISPRANFKITCLIPALDNQGNLQGIETMVTDVFNKFTDASVVLNISSVSAPTILTIGNSDLLAADISITVLTSWS